MRFLMVDRILELESGRRATGIKNITLSEGFLEHHFPEMPIMPGSLIVEALVQLADWILRENSGFQEMGLPSSFAYLKFRRVVRPGDQLQLNVEALSHRGAQAEFKGTASRGGQAVATARFTLDVRSVEPLLTVEESRRIFEMIQPQSERVGNYEQLRASL